MAEIQQNILIFESILYNIIKVMSSGLEVVFAFILLSRFFSKRYLNKWLIPVAFSLSTAVIIALQERGFAGEIKTIAEIIIVALISVTLYSGKLKEKVVFNVIFSIILAFSDLLSYFVVSWVFNKITIINTESFLYRVLNLELPYLIMLAFVALLSLFIKNKKSGAIRFRYWVMLLTVPAVTLITLTVYQFYLGQLMPNQEIGIYIYISTAGLLFINVLVFVLFSRLQNQLEIERNNRNMLYQMDLQKQSIDKLEASYNRTRELRHDLKNHLAAMYSMLNQNDYDSLRGYLNTMVDTVEDSTYIAVSENSAVDAILNEKLFTAQSNKTNMRYEICNLKSTKAKSVDLCIILSNALDNAIEACKKIENDEDRYVRVKVDENDDFLVISVINPVFEEPKENAFGFISSKPDSKNHGIGIKSIKNTASKYSGDVMTKCENKLFTIIIKLNFN